MKALALLIVGSLTVLGIVTNSRLEPLVIYNPSQSVPSGFYMRVNEAPRHGGFVTVAAVGVEPAYAALRGYADATDRFLKRVAALPGQVVCAEGPTITIDNAPAASRIKHDSEGRALPTWHGCRTLAADEVFLLGDTEDSFDGRYWGPTRLRDIDGVWSPI